MSDKNASNKNTVEITVYLDGSARVTGNRLGQYICLSKAELEDLHNQITLKECDHPEHIYLPSQREWTKPTPIIGTLKDVDDCKHNKNQSGKFICRYCGDWLTRTPEGDGKWHTYKKAGTFDNDCAL